VIAQTANLQNEVALIALAGRNHRTVFASPPNGLKTVEPELTLLTGLAVAGEAIGCENGAYVIGVSDICPGGDWGHFARPAGENGGHNAKRGERGQANYSR
jgi:hypothetical protein